MTRRDDAIGRRLRGAAIVAAAVFLLLLGIVAAATAWGDELPDDPKLLKAMIGALRSSLARRNAEIAALGKRIEAQAAEIRRLRAAATTRPATTGPATQAASWSPDTGPAPFRRS